jgi:biotin carboxyl carrier protein
MSHYVTTINGKKFEIDITKDGDIMVNGKKREVDFRALGPSLYSIIMQNKSHELVIEEREGSYEVMLRGHLYTGEVLDERAQFLAAARGSAGAESGELSIKSPMPGLVVAIPVNEGDVVQQGQTVIILESMKMQNELKAPREGTVQRISAKAGESVERGKLLITIV